MGTLISFPGSGLRTNHHVYLYCLFSKDIFEINLLTKGQKETYTVIANISVQKNNFT